MGLNVNELLQSPVIRLDIIDSTNNYAMRMIDADKAYAGMTIVASQQTNGKGQRGNKWMDEQDESLLMSIVVEPIMSADAQFGFNAAVAVAVAEVVNGLYCSSDVKIKWPNDIIVNDKKTGGILIENIFRGSNWSYSVIGVGINVLQKSFPPDLPHATSLLMASGKEVPIEELLHPIRQKIISNISDVRKVPDFIEKYNQFLFKKNKMQNFTNINENWQVLITGVNNNGELVVQLENGDIACYTHGKVLWQW